jgi:hypothetical protein
LSQKDDAVVHQPIDFNVSKDDLARHAKQLQEESKTEEIKGTGDDKKQETQSSVPVS